jgi:hypothetical protein
MEEARAKRQEGEQLRANGRAFAAAGKLNAAGKSRADGDAMLVEAKVLEQEALQIKKQLEGTSVPQENRDLIESKRNFYIGPGRSASGVAPSVRDAGYTRSLPAPAPYNVVGERAQYEEDNFLPYAYSPPLPAGPAPVPRSPSDFTIIGGQIVPKQPAPHPYANVPSVPPPVDQPYYEPSYEPLDTTSQGYNLPQYIRAQEKYPHPSEADIDYRIRRIYGPHPSGPSIPIPQP